MLRRRKRMQDNPTQPDLPITPMLDMSFQLMAFFICTFKPGPTEGQLSLMLPREGNTVAAPASLTPTDEKRYVGYVRIVRNTLDFRLQEPTADASVKTRPEPKAIAPNGQPFVKGTPGSNLDTEVLVAELRKIIDAAEAANAQLPAEAKIALPKLDLQFDGEVTCEVMIRLLNDAKRAKFSKVTPMLLNEAEAMANPDKKGG